MPEKLRRKMLPFPQDNLPTSRETMKDEFFFVLRFDICSRFQNGAKKEKLFIARVAETFQRGVCHRDGIVTMRRVQVRRWRAQDSL